MNSRLPAPAKAQATFVAVGIALLMACGGSSDSPSPAPTAPSPPPPSTTFQGTIGTATGQRGTIDITVQAAVAAVRPWLGSPFLATLHAQGVAATGTLRTVGGATTALTGTYDSGMLNLSGGGVTLTGRAERGVLSGRFSGTSSGAFSTLSTAGSTITRYCGTFTGRDAGTREEYRGVFNIQTSAGGQASGFAIVTDAPRREFVGLTNFLTGQVAGSTVTLTGTDGGGTGTIQNGRISGTGDNNTVFSGTTTACQ